MPLFGWEAPSRSVVNLRFWIYWAVTIPATLMGADHLEDMVCFRGVATDLWEGE